MWSDPDDVEIWAVSPRGAGWLFGASITREVRPYLVLFLCSSLLRCMHSLTTSIHSRSSLGRISSCRRAINICSTRRWRPCGPRQTTATAVGTWPRFSLSVRTAHVASQCMVLPRRMSETWPNNGRDVWCVACSFTRGRLCMLTWGLSKGEYAILCVDQCRRRIDFTVSCILFRPLRSNALSRSAGSLAICLPTHHLNPYGVRVTSPTSAKCFPSKHGRSCRHFQATSRFTSSHNTKGLSPRPNC